MRKEYSPAIVLFIISAILYVSAAVLLYLKSHHWATVLLLGIVAMLFASSRLVKIGKKLREDDEKNEKR